MIVLPDDINKEVNKGIDRIILELVEEGENILESKVMRNKDDIYEIIGNIREWYKIRGDYSTLDYLLDNRYFELYIKFMERERL